MEIGLRYGLIEHHVLMKSLQGYHTPDMMLADVQSLHLTEEEKVAARKDYAEMV